MTPVQGGQIRNPRPQKGFLVPVSRRAPPNAFKNPSKNFQEGVKNDDALGFPGLENQFQGPGFLHQEMKVLTSWQREAEPKGRKSETGHTKRLIGQNDQSKSEGYLLLGLAPLTLVGALLVACDPNATSPRGRGSFHRRSIGFSKKGSAQKCLPFRRRSVFPQRQLETSGNKNETPRKQGGAVNNCAQEP